MDMRRNKRQTDEEYERRAVAMSTSLLLPGSNMARIGKEWGISRERVRQIFKKRFKVNPSVAYSLLKDESTKFRCTICGKQQPETRIRKYSKYCSNKCREVFNKWDFKNPRECFQCKITYFPHRNAEWVHQGEKQFCSIQCYVDSGIVGRAGYRPYLTPREVRRCIACNKAFVCKTKSTQKYCTHECFRNRRKPKNWKLKKTTP